MLKNASFLFNSFGWFPAILLIISLLVNPFKKGKKASAIKSHEQIFLVVLEIQEDQAYTQKKKPSM